MLHSWPFRRAVLHSNQWPRLRLDRCVGTDSQSRESDSLCQTVGGWFNRAAFALPALGPYVNLAYNKMKEPPGVFQFNMALSSTFQFMSGRRFGYTPRRSTFRII